MEGVRQGYQYVSRPFVYAAQFVKKTIVLFADAVTPASRWVMVVGVIVGIWAHRMAEVYSPQILTKLIIKYSVYSMQNQYVGWAWGAFFLAPGLVPTMVPYVAYGIATVAGCIVIIACNRLHLAFVGNKTPKGGKP